MLPLPINEIWRMSCYIKGRRCYRAVLFIGYRQHGRSLKRICLTATGAMKYGQRVLDRYQNWCKTASLKENSPIQPAGHSK
jgi:hypothetical protein